MTKQEQLLALYTEFPCRTLPNAFWKTASRLDDAELILSRDDFGALSSLVIWDGARLTAFYCADPAHHPLTPNQVASVSFALVHAKALPVFARRKFFHRRSYFRIAHSGEVDKHAPPAGFGFETFNPDLDLEAAVNMLSICYPAFKINQEIVQSWLTHPVYDPGLWLWVIDHSTGEKAGLGIAERDPQVPEASLEWIQVHPAYHGKGLGKAIVTELLKRASDQAKFTTVSGEAENPYQPESLYRRCGFKGEDVWWLLSDAG